MPTPTPDMLKRYLSDLSSPEEAQVVLEWLATKEGQVFYNTYLTKRIDHPDKAVNPSGNHDEPKTLGGVYDRINRREGEFTKRNTWYRVAAAIALLILSAWIILYIVRPDQRVIETAYGETQRLQLDDGTRITINANSRLWYQTGQPREVWLEGEAFFEVFHTQNDASFEVHTPDLMVNVLGTEFNVNTRHEKTDVVLSNGRVRLDIESDSDPESLIMQPGDKISYSQQESTLQRQAVDTNPYTSWVNGKIIFDHTPLQDVFRLMEDTYGVDIRVNDPAVLAKEFTGEVRQDLEVLLTLLQKSFGLKVSKQGSTIFLE